jgi:hypothetical protein
MPRYRTGPSEDGVAKALMKHVAGFDQCMSTCVVGEFKRGSTAGGCIQNPPTYAKTRARPASIKARTAASIDRACFRPGRTAPACWSTRLDAETKWAEMSELVLITARRPLSYCGESE